MKLVLGQKAAHNGNVVYSLDFEVTPHQLRHTYITNLIHASVDPKTVQYLAYNGMRMALAHITGEHEYFSIEDMMEITGESREEVLKQVEDMRAAALAAGENPDDYVVPVERKILYFPDGFTS